MKRRKYFPDIIIIYERKNREYYTSYLLKCELEKRGYTVWLCHHSYQKMCVAKLLAKPKFVITLCALTTELKRGWSVLEQHTCYLRGNAEYIINLQAEQLFRNQDCSYNIVEDRKFRDKLYYVCWGQWRKQQILSKGIDEDHIIVTGALQIDLCHKRFETIYKNKEQIGEIYNIDSEKEWILFISSFPYVTYSDEEFQWGAKVQKQYDKKADIKDIYFLKECAVGTYKVLLEWMERFLECNDKIILYRPHPGEKETELIKRLKQKFPDKFFFIREENIQQWGKVCEYVDTWVSTALVETVFSGNTCNILQPLGAPAKFQPVFMDDLPKIKSYNEFVDAHCVDRNNGLEEIKEKLNVYYQTDEELAYEKIANLVDELNKKEPVVLEPRDVKKVLKYIFSKQYLLCIYASFVLKFQFGLGKLILKKDSKLRKFEERLYVGGDIYDECKITWVDVERTMKIKDIISGNYSEDMK